MTTYYRNRHTGLVQAHPVSGIGESLNADEIGEDGKAVKPFTTLAPTADEIRNAKALLKDNTASPLDVAASEDFLARAAKDNEKEAARKAAADAKAAAKAEAAAAKTSTPSEIGGRSTSAIGSQTTEANTGTGDSNKEGGI